MADTRLIVLRRLVLKPEHRPTGKTRHYYGASELPPPSILKVVKYADDQGYYLFYCDDAGEEFTDTYHESLEAALAQAEWEFGVKPTEWESIEA
jgi:hypothetical protein